MPELIIESAVSRTVCSVMLQANLFQLFQPIGGVSASPFGALFTTSCVVSASAGVHIANNASNAAPILPRPIRLSIPQFARALTCPPRGRKVPEADRGVDGRGLIYGDPLR